MSPYQIKILLHYHTCANDYPNEEGAPIFSNTMVDFVAQGLLEAVIVSGDMPVGGPKYRMTERGDVYCRHLINTPLPIQRWSIP